MNFIPNAVVQQPSPTPLDLLVTRYSAAIGGAYQHSMGTVDIEGLLNHFLADARPLIAPLTETPGGPAEERPARVFADAHKLDLSSLSVSASGVYTLKCACGAVLVLGEGGYHHDEHLVEVAVAAVSDSGA